MYNILPSHTRTHTCILANIYPHPHLCQTAAVHTHTHTQTHTQKHSLILTEGESRKFDFEDVRHACFLGTCWFLCAGAGGDGGDPVISQGVRGGHMYGESVAQGKDLAPLRSQTAAQQPAPAYMKCLGMSVCAGM